MLLGENAGELSFACPGRGRQVQREIGRAEDRPHCGGVDWDRHRVGGEPDQAQAGPDRLPQLWPFRGVGQPEPGKRLRRLHLHPWDGACGPGRPGGVKVASSPAVFAPAKVGVEAPLRYVT